MADMMQMTPVQVRDLMLAQGVRRAYIVWDQAQGKPVASHPVLDPVAKAFAADNDYHKHEGIFFEIGSATGYLMGAFVFKTKRGAAAGGVRLWNYNNFQAYCKDGLRLGMGMGRKSALAGIWWGGGKGVIAALDPAQIKDRLFRDALFSEYGCFISSINGCYVTAPDLGVTGLDIVKVYERTRFTTCVSEKIGGSGNPSIPTGYGIVCGMEAALEFLGSGGSVAGKSVAVMGCGNVATAMTEKLLEKGIGKIIAADVNADAVEAYNAKWGKSGKVTARVAAPGDFSILYEDVDIVSPCAVGGVLNPTTIPQIKAKIVCGSANNQLLDDKADAKLLKEKGIYFVVDFIVNRMGIVQCANEQYGRLAKDPAIERHFDNTWEHGIYQVVLNAFRVAKQRGITEVEAANALAEEAMEQLHPIWGHRGQQIIDDLRNSSWEKQTTLSK